MKILGLSFGHHASIFHIDTEKRIYEYISTERNSRIKEASGIDLSYIDKIDLDGAAIGLTSTQNWPIIFDSSLYQFDIEGIRNESFSGYLKGMEQRDKNGFDHLTKTTSWIKGIENFDAAWFDDKRDWPWALRDTTKAHQTFATLQSIKITSKLLRTYFIKKGTVHLKKSNKTYDVTFVNHHFAHAWYAAAAASIQQLSAAGAPAACR